MPQDLFTYCTAAGALMHAAGGASEFNETLQTYYRDYPSEGRELQNDLDTCIVEVLRMCEIFNRQLGPRSSSEEKDDLVGVTTWVSEEIKRMNKFVDSQSKPWWRRLLKGTRFNYSTNPLPDRKERAITAVSLALSHLHAKTALGAIHGRSNR